MTDLDLARRAVACKHWRWQSGMEEVRRGRVMDVVTHDGETLARALVRNRSTAYMDGSVNLMWTAVTSAWLPDLNDPATVGCLLAMVRVAYGDETLCTRSMATVKDSAWTDGPWWVQSTGSHVQICVVSGDTEAAALVAALEAAQ